MDEGTVSRSAGIGARPTMAELLGTLPQTGRVRWIGRRPARRAPMESVEQATLTVEGGLLGDRYAGRSGTRQVTLLQFEHLDTLASLLGAPVSAADLRRNVLVSGLNLLALKGRRFRIGGAVLEHTGACHPCSRMEETLGSGGYNAVRGHGGITARVIEPGDIRLQDAVALAQALA